LLEPPWSKESDHIEWRERVTTIATKKKRSAVEVVMRNEKLMQSFFFFCCITTTQFSWAAGPNARRRSDRTDARVLSLPNEISTFLA